MLSWQNRGTQASRGECGGDLGIHVRQRAEGKVPEGKEAHC